MTHRLQPTRRRAATAAVALLVSTGLAVEAVPAGVAAENPATTEDASSPAAGVTLGINPRPAIAGETVTGAGRVDTRVARPVSIQVWTNGAWHTEELSQTNAKGQYSISFKVPSEISVRTLARQIRIKGKYYPKRTSSSRTLKVTDQTSTVRILPPISQPGSKPASASRAKNVVFASFSPARPGRRAVAQRRDGKTWKTVSESVVNDAGRVSFRVPQGKGGKEVIYRVKLYGARGAKPIATQARSTTASIGSLRWEDQFNGTKLSDEWMLMDPEYDTVANRRCSKGSTRAYKVRGGTLDLKVLLDPERVKETCRAYGRDNRYQINGAVSTRQTQHFTYGYAAARIKFHRLRGQHSAFWLTTDHVNNGTEVDVAEWFGKQTNTMANNIYIRKNGVKKRKYGGAVKNLDSFLTSQSDAWYSRYHVFSVEWTKKQYVFRIDGRTTFSTKKGHTNKKMFVWLTNLSGDYELHFMDPKNYPQTTSVDWVRIWGL